MNYTQNRVGKICPLCSSQSLSKRQGSGEFGYVECPDCQLLVCDPLPSEAELLEFYNRTYEVNFENYSSKIYPKRRKDVHYMLENFSFNNVLEIGCSYGSALLEFQQAGKKAVGVEIALEAREYARQSGLEVYEQVADVLRHYGKEKFDLVVSWHVIEHLFIEGTVGIFTDCVAKEGFVFLVTPNAHSYQRIVFGSYWEWHTPPAHMYLYSQYGLSFLLLEASYAIVRQQTREGDANSFSLNTVIALKRWLNNLRSPHGVRNGSQLLNISSRRIQRLTQWGHMLKPLDFLFLPLQSLFCSLGLGSEIVILARKISK